MRRALLGAEMRRLVRNRRTFLFSAALPVVFFLAFTSGDATERLGGLEVGLYIMVNMAAFGAMNALFAAGGVIAAERAVGWTRQLRVAGLRGRDYLVVKVAVAYVTATVGVGLVFAAGAMFKDMPVDALRWFEAMAVVLVCLLPLGALGVVVGSAVHPRSLPALFGVATPVLALLGGLWSPAQHMPSLLRAVVEALPVYWAGAAGRAALGGDDVGWRGVPVVVGWTLVLGAIAVWVYRRDGLRPAVAGTT